MYCPQCRVEYREGFTECSDCRVPLVAELPAESADDAALETSVLEVTSDPAFLNDAMALLDEANIAFNLESQGSHIPEDEEIDLADGPIRIRVSVRDESAAREQLRELVENYSLSEEDLSKLHGSLDEELSAFVTDAPDALVTAAAAQSEAAVETLLEQGVDVNQSNDAGQTALMAAAHAGHETIVQSLLDAGANVRAKDPHGISALHLASRRGQTSIVERLLEKDAETNPQDGDGRTALMLASEYGHLECVARLLKNGADPSLEDNKGETASTLAENMGHADVGRVLAFKQGQDSHFAEEATDDEGRTELIIAASQGEVDLMAALIDAGADISAVDEKGRTALICAAAEGQTEAAMTLLSRGANIDEKDQEGCTAISWAADQGHLETVRALLDRGADASLADSQGWTPLKFAEHASHNKIADMLREATA